QSTRNDGISNSFAYDTAFNPTTFRNQTHTFNANNQDTAQTYDGNGNPHLLGAYSLSFDPENRLTQVGSLLTAGYDGDDLRAWKQDNVGNRTYFLGPCELDGSGNLIATNTFGPTGLLSRHTASGSTFYTFDPQGSVNQRTDSGGNVINTSLFDAFGQKLDSNAQTDPWGYNAQSGYFTDAETGLILCTHRYYDPAAGRWL